MLGVRISAQTSRLRLQFALSGGIWEHQCGSWCAGSDRFDKKRPKIGNNSWLQQKFVLDNFQNVKTNCVQTEKWNYGPHLKIKHRSFHSISVVKALTSYERALVFIATLYMKEKSNDHKTERLWVSKNISNAAGLISPCLASATWGGSLGP